MTVLSLSKSFVLSWRRWLWAAAGLGIGSLALAWVASGFLNLGAWLPFLGMLALGAGVMALAWWALRSSEGALPGWLLALFVGAALLRLGAGAIWFTALPVAGHGSPAELKGYIMADAYERDQAAWKLANSNKPLLSAFRNFRTADQYGGLLFLSALLYRTVGQGVPAEAAPLLIVVLAAAFSALAAPFTWAFSRRVWGEEVARVAAWGIALYPEAVLLGSTQMREAFTIPLAAAALYGLVRYGQDQHLSNLAWLVGALLLYVPFSPPFVGLLMIMLALVALVWRDSLYGQLFNRKIMWLAGGVLVLLVLAGLWYSWRHLAPARIQNPVDLVQWWFKTSGEWQAYLTRHSSGKIQALFARTPDWLQAPLLLGYGILQPFLPAALIARSAAPFWTGVQIWRALGWTPLLALLLYAPLRALRAPLRHSFALGLSLAVWLAILVISYRGGSDLWDTPRYRAAFAALEVGLAAWAWKSPRRKEDPWLRRVLVGLGLVLFWFIPWYLVRYASFAWPVQDILKTLILGFVSVALFSLWDWARLARVKS